MEGSAANLAEKPAAAAQAAGTAPAAEEKDSRRNFNYSLVKYSDMTDEMRAECVDLVVTAVEKHSNNFEAGSKYIKELMDKKFGSSWHVVIGEGFGFEVTHDMRNLLYMFFGGAVGILLWKAS